MTLPPIQIVSDAEAESAALVVCMRLVDMPVAQFPDDVITDCAHGCGFKIRHRPHSPKAPPKVCMQCALEMVKGGRA